MNYGELKTEVLDIAHLTTGDVVGARVAKFIKRAEDMIARKVRALEMMTTVGLAEVNRSAPGSAVYNMPDRSLDVITMSVSGEPRICQRRGVYELTFYFDQNSGPVHSYAVRAGAGLLQVQFRAIPGLNATMAAQIWQRPATLSADADVNALLTNHEGLYLHGALHWLYIDAHELQLARDHLELFKADAADVNALCKSSLRAGQIAALEHNFEAGGSGM